MLYLASAKKLYTGKYEKGQYLVSMLVNDRHG